MIEVHLQVAAGVLEQGEATAPLHAADAAPVADQVIAETLNCKPLLHWNLHPSIHRLSPAAEESGGGHRVSLNKTQWLAGPGFSEARRSSGGVVVFDCDCRKLLIAKDLSS